MKKYEPLLSTKFVMSFDIPEALFPENLNPVKFEDGVITVDRLESNNGVKKTQVNRLCRKIQNDIDNIDIDFKERQDDSSVREWMKQWIELANQSFKKEGDGLMRYFTFCEDEQDPDSIAMKLIKPLNQLTLEEKNEIKELLLGISNIEEETLNKFLEL